jgi:hypothetical protein
MHRLFGGILLLQFHQVLAHALVHLRRFPQLLAWNAALLRRIRLHETAIDRQVLALHQSISTHCLTICSNSSSNSFDS